MDVKTIATLVAAVSLAGCASFDDIAADVSAFSRWPAVRSPATYAFERLPSQQARPQQAQMLEDAARNAVEYAGFIAVPEGQVADVTVQLSARISEADRSPYDDPFWYGGFRTWHRPVNRFDRPFGAGSRRGYWVPGSALPFFEREVAVLIRDRRTGEPLFESHAKSEGFMTGETTILPALFVAAMKDFPAGSTTNPHRITVDTPN